MIEDGLPDDSVLDLGQHLWVAHAPATRRRQQRAPATSRPRP
ncbi:hypothetical protein [Streptomyces sp. NPDC058872]